MEAHAHADHLSAAPHLKTRIGARVAIGEYIRDVQSIFRPVFNVDDVSREGGEFDRLLRDGETLNIGDLTVDVLHTPGHTPACVPYRLGDSVFVASAGMRRWLRPHCCCLLSRSTFGQGGGPRSKPTGFAISRSRCACRYDRNAHSVASSR